MLSRATNCFMWTGFIAGLFGYGSVQAAALARGSTFAAGSTPSAGYDQRSDLSASGSSSTIDSTSAATAGLPTGALGVLVTSRVRPDGTYGYATAEARISDMVTITAPATGIDSSVLIVWNFEGSIRPPDFQWMNESRGDFQLSFSRSSPTFQSVGASAVVDCRVALCYAPYGDIAVSSIGDRVFEFQGSGSFRVQPGTYSFSASMSAITRGGGFVDASHTLQLTAYLPEGTSMSSSSGAFLRDRTFPISAVPEPATTALWLAGLALMPLLVRRRIR